jgi:arylsulfatase
VQHADYQIPFAFSGRIERITLSIDRPQLSPADIQMLQHAQRSKSTTE